MSVAPPRPTGPPLNALRAFEASARLGGFKAAAEELCVTPGAVAQQVKNLELWAGADLFERKAQGVRLTPLGRRALADLTRAFDLVGTVAQALRAEAAPLDIRIAALPSIAQLWLSPRLPTIRVVAPEARISVTALEHRPNLLREPFDLSLFFEPHPLPAGLIEIGRDAIFPVCAPSLARNLRRPKDLARETLLRDASWATDWDLWAEAAAPGLQPDRSGPVFSLFSLAVEEAKAGGGVLIGHELLVRPLLDAGNLVAPFPQRVALDRSLTLDVAAAAKANPALTRLTNALLDPAPLR